jgi:myo-inositol-1(or 4)-monophosphatase
MEPTAMVEAFCSVADSVRETLDGLDDWVRVPDTPSQYRHDVVADAVAVPMLLDAGFGVLSEESGVHEPDRAIIAVLDPVDGSTNASIGLPWFATSIAAVRRDLIGAPGDETGTGAVVASMVRNQALGVTYTAVAGQGARRDGARIAPSPCRTLSDAIVVVNDLPPRLGARQFRVYGAAALDLCAVADCTFDGFVDCGLGLAPWDHLGAALVCVEAGASISCLDGGPLVDLDAGSRQAVVAGACAAVRDELRAVVNTAVGAT